MQKKFWNHEGFQVSENVKELLYLWLLQSADIRDSVQHGDTLF